ncbi:MAG: beta-propeller domain-containing protein [Dehalococcoidia bacterium]|nr:beta-propeller domain-containing protein [Dehalococcoidia bacterium]
MKTVLSLAMVLAVIAAVTVGCFAVSGSSIAEPAGDEVGTPVEWKPEPSLAGGLQLFSSYQELNDFLNTAPSYPGYFYWGAERGALTLDGASAFSVPENELNYSQTNIQVEGVDEADIVKSDGQYIYLATDNRLIIAGAYPPAKARIVSELEFEGNIDGLFVNGDRLVVLESNWLTYAYGLEREMSHGYMEKTSVRVYDVTDREKPVLKREMSVDGCYISARLIGDYVYLVASGSAWIDGGNVSLPRISSDNSAVEIQPSEIWHSETPDNGYAFTTIVSVNMVNDDEEPVHETLVLGSASTIYVSPSNIYVTFTDWSGGSEMTSVHRIHIDEGRIEYHATGEVPGRLLNQFSMDEQGEYFRVATTIGYAWGGGTKSTSSVYVLDQSLDIYGRLENLAPGEQIYSARFLGGRCYLVTFKTVDPLFVIDLANPGNPKVLGELKIPGYSEYLHPYDENHVIGVGKDVDESIDADKVHEDDAVYYTAVKGVKLSLFDVTDVSSPKEIAKYVIGDRGTESPVMYDYKAFLFDRSKNLLVLPVSVVEINSSDHSGDMLSWGYEGSWWQGAYVFDISLERGLELKGRITHCDGEDSVKGAYSSYYGYSYCSIERSLYIGNVLYTISDQKIGMNDLETLEKIGEISLAE